MRTVLLTLVLILSTSSGGAAHDKHVSFGQMGIEGRVAIIQIRFFRHDLEAALQRFDGPAFRLDDASRADAVFAAYFDEHFRLTAGEERLPGRVVASGEDGEMWWFTVRFDAPAPLAAFTLRNTLLFDAFPAQRNTVKVARFPGGRTETLYFTRDAEAYDVSA